MAHFTLNPEQYGERIGVQLSFIDDLAHLSNQREFGQTRLSLETGVARMIQFLILNLLVMPEQVLK